MSDIIKDAKQLLEGATLGPWEWVGYDLEQAFEAGGAIVMDATCENPHLGGVVNVEITPEDERLIAAAPELAQALAEETYEYAVQVKIGAKWLFLGRGTGGHNFARNAFWFEKKEKAQGYQLIRQETAPTRIVRRRVSPPEVIND